MSSAVARRIVLANFCDSRQAGRHVRRAVHCPACLCVSAGGTVRSVWRSQAWTTSRSRWHHQAVRCNSCVVCVFFFNLETFECFRPRGVFFVSLPLSLRLAVLCPSYPQGGSRPHSARQTQQHFLLLYTYPPSNSREFVGGRMYDENCAET